MTDNIKSPDELLEEQLPSSQVEEVKEVKEEPPVVPMDTTDTTNTKEIPSFEELESHAQAIENNDINSPFEHTEVTTENDETIYIVEDEAIDDLVEKEDLENGDDNSDSEENSDTLISFENVPSDQSKRILVKSLLLKDDLSNLPTYKPLFCKVNVQSNPYTYMDEKTWTDKIRKENESDIPLPSVSKAQFYDIVSHKLNYDTLNSNNESSEKLNSALNNVYRLVPNDGVLDRVIYDENREFNQELVDDETGSKLKPNKPSFLSKSNVLPTGEIAVIRMNAMRGKGDIFQVPLYHSGFWITLRAPSDIRLITLEEDVMKTYIALGRYLGGVMNSNDHVYLSEMIYDLAKECIYDTTLVNRDKDSLAEKIDIHDLPILAWGLACTIWSNGYYFHRSVLSRDGYTDKVVHGKIDLSKLLWVDRKSLTQKQIKQLVRKSKPSVNDQDLTRYKEQFNVPTTRKIKIDDLTTIEIGSSTIADHLNYGIRWVEECVSHVEEVLTEEATDEKRNNVINNYAKATKLGQYRHYIKSVILENEVTGQEEVYSDQETLDKMISSLTQEITTVNKIISAIREFIDDSTVAIIGTPSVDEEEDKVSSKRFPNLIQLDPIYTFFSLAVRRAQQIKERELFFM